MLHPTRILLQHRQPMIRFLGKRHPTPAAVDHSPQPHPASPTHSLPDSFATYRQNAIQHGPLKGRASSSTSSSSKASPGDSAPVGDRPGAALGPVEAPKGEFFDRSELPRRFQRMVWSDAEIEAIDSGGATLA